MNKKHYGYQTQLAQRLVFQYLLALCGLLMGMALLVLLGVQLRHMIEQTQDANPLTQLLYAALNWAADYFPLVLAILFLLGWLVITYLFMRQPLRYLDELIAAAEKMAQPESAPITLPAALRSAQDQLNLARQQALRNAALAREAEQRKNDLIVYLAHDLKTPLTSVIGYLTLLRDEPELSPALRAKYTGIALDKAERLEELVNEFFDITRFNLSRLTLETAPVDLAMMLRQVASEFGPVLTENRLECRLDLPPKLEYDCDAGKLARVFDNLLRNAVSYSFPDTAIEISARREEGQIVLTFANAGKTIPPEKLERLFEQFFRLDSARASRTGGAGLGLAIAKEIVELHGGTIQAESRDNRVVFTVRMPC